MRYYAIIDNNVKLSNSPFDARSDLEAKQIVINLLKHVSDEALKRILTSCSLYCVGEFDIQKYSFKHFDPFFICNLSDFDIGDCFEDSEV